jgi:hypothetical protein
MNYKTELSASDLISKICVLKSKKISASVIPARFWLESRKAAGWIPAEGMPE